MVPEMTEDRGYMGYVRDILCHPVFQSMGQYIQHGTTICKTHCMRIPYLGYGLCKQLEENWRSATRTGLPRDLFLYDWRTHAKETGQYFHGFTHPRAALENADRYFRLAGEERTIILRHMWPLALIPPTSEAEYIAACADKYCSTVETMARFKHWIRMCLSAQPTRR